MERIKFMIYKKVYLQLFYSMLRIRMVEEKIAELYPEQEMRCPVHLCVGQEAIPAGVSANLCQDDYVLSNHRSHGHYLAKGGDLKAMMAELYGKSTGCSRGKGGSMHLIDRRVGFLGATPIVGSSIPIAVGTSLASLMRREGRVSVVFFGDAATEEGVFYESMNFAVLKKLPVIFICENNFYSVCSPLSVRQPQKREIFHIAKAFGMPSFQGDGNDVIDVYRLVKKVISKVRRKCGPAFLEFKTYRWKEHCGPDYDHGSGYRTEREFQKWRRRCPIEKLERSLFKKGVLRKSDINKMVSRIKAEIEEAVIFAKDSPSFYNESLLEHVYSQ
jgi:TPP-dependent pyruvate/acetoin dehydrogenase alpha subunit